MWQNKALQNKHAAGLVLRSECINKCARHAGKANVQSEALYERLPTSSVGKLGALELEIYSFLGMKYDIYIAGSSKNHVT